MNSHRYLLITLVAALALTLPSFSHAKPDDKAEDYAVDGKFHLPELVEYLIDYLDIPYRDLRPTGTKKPATLASKLANTDIAIALASIKNTTQKSPPYTLAEVQRSIPQDPGTLAKYQALPAWKKIPGITEPLQKIEEEYDSVGEVSEPKVKTFAGSIGEIYAQREANKKDPTIEPSTAKPVSRGSIGPFRLRRSVDALMDYSPKNRVPKSWLETETTGDLADLQSIPGAKLGFSDNRLLDGDGAWSSEGALIYPLHHWSQSDRTASHAGLALSWKIEEQEKPATPDIDELKFSAPLGQVMWHRVGRKDAVLFIGAEPYYQTDTDFDGGIIGATASFEVAGLPKYLGTYDRITTIGGRDLDMRIRAIGLVDYSDVRDTSPYIKRTLDDDWFRLGAQFSIEFGLFPTDTLSKQPPITIGASYRFMQEVGDDNGGYSDLFKANATLWLSPNAGLTLEYQKGETPVADKDIDLITLGLELKL